MREHLNQYVFSPLSWILMILLVILLSLVLLFLTPIGPKTAAKLSTLGVHALKLEGISGTFLSGLKIKRFEWQGEAGIFLDNVSVAIRKYEVDSGMLYAKHVKAGQLDIHLPQVSKSGDGEADIPDFDLPVNLDAALISLGKLRILDKQNVVFEVDQIQLNQGVIKSGKLNFAKLKGSPIIEGIPLELNLFKGFLNMKKPHHIETQGTVSYLNDMMIHANGEIDLSGTLTHYQLETQLEATLKMRPELERLGQQVLIIKSEGDYNQLAFRDIQLSGKQGVLNGKGQLEWSPQPGWDFSLNTERIALQTLFPNIPFTAKSTLDYQGGYSDGTLHGEFNITELQGEWQGFPLVVSGKVAQRDTTAHAEALLISIGDNQLRLDGQLAETLEVAWALNAENLNQLSNDVKGQAYGSGELQGSYEDITINTKLALKNIQYADYKQGKEVITLRGLTKLQQQNIQLDEVVIESPDNRLNLSGSINEPMSLKVSVDAKKLQQFSADMAGNIKGTAKITGKYKTPDIEMDINASQLSYQQKVLIHSPLNAKGELQIRDGVPLVKHMRAHAGQNTFTVSGKASSPFDLSWHLDGRQLQQISPEVSGYAVIKGQLKGTVDKPIINANIDARNVKYQDYQLKGATLNAITNNGLYTLKGNLQGLRVKNEIVDTATIDAKGRIDNHLIDITFKHPKGDGKLIANGTWNNPAWSGTVKSLALKNKEYGDLRLQKPVTISASAEAFKAQPFCLENKLKQEVSTLCSNTTLWNSSSGLVAKGALKKTPLARFKIFLPENIELNGTASGSYDVKQIEGELKGKVNLVFPDSSVILKGDGDDEQFYTYKDARLDAVISDNVVSVDAKMHIVNRGVISSKSIIKLSPKNGKHTIKGEAQFDVPNINWAQDFIPRTRGLVGKLGGRLKYSGLLNKPEIEGQISLKKGYLRLPEAGSELSNIDISMRAEKTGVARISGKMNMGKGVLNVNGTMDFKNLPRWKSKLNITGNNIQFMNTNEINARVTPDLIVEASPSLIEFKGKLHIPSANINLRDLPELSIDESDDVFVKGEAHRGESVSALKIRPNVQVTLGDQVRMNAFGLKSRLSGNVLVSNSKNEIITRGGLKVSDGSYSAYGQELKIEAGRLIFNGSPKQVGMDIKALRNVEFDGNDDALVGIRLTGTVNKPKSTIYSEPALPEDEALSYLLTGNSLASASGRDSALLMSAVRGLGIAGSDSLLSKIGRSVGLDDVNLVTREDLKKTELELGKRLGSRLYVKYFLGLFDNAQKIAIDYKLNKYLSLEAQSSPEANGLDFIYKIEK